MSFQYDQYLANHRANVKRGFDWLCENLADVTNDILDAAWQIEFAHDKSKDEEDEYNAYDAYFYGNNRSYKVVQDYQKAWLTHIHRNPHHWQYWILIHDDMENGELETILEMPYNYIVEMICDWWAFSWANGNLYEIFNWYAEHSKFMKLAPRTRETVENILDKIRNRLDSMEVEHSGVKGMKWGVRNGPPYPIKDNGRVATVQKHGTIKTTKIPREKFTEYALNPDKAPNKARAFKSALGYTKDNADELINSINEHFDVTKLEERGDGGYGMRYQQIMKLKGPNEKEANVLTAWIKDGNDGIKLTSAYVTKKEASE